MDVKVAQGELQKQREYVKQLELEGFDYGIVVAGAFVRGIRDIGYKSTGTALDELVDNAIQAGARRIHVMFGYGNSDAKPSAIAVVDDGHGMDPAMVRLSTIWGGTHREGDRTGFGRYGYGLPSACVSQGRKFSVYSKVEGGVWHRVTLDIDELATGAYQQDGSKLVVPQAVEAVVPDWIAEHEDMPQSHGTIVVIEKLDEIDWNTTRALEMHLLQHFGITYRNYLHEVALLVNDKGVGAVDPLFITPSARFYDTDEDRAEAIEPITFEVKDREDRRALGTVKVRLSSLPPAFGAIDKSRDATGKNRNPRMNIMTEHNGIIVLRAGRQIDVVTRCPWTTFVNYDRYWNVEVDFPPTLDEEFSITTSKQQVVLSQRIWELLERAGVPKAIETLRKRNKEARAKHEASRESDPGVKRPSEITMEQAEKFNTKAPGGDPVERDREAKKRLEDEARRRAKLLDVPVDKAQRELEAEVEDQRYKVREESMPGAPFFRVEQLGGQKALYLNTAHRFYTDVYVGPESTPRLRAALELVLFVIGECEIDAVDDRRVFYGAERALWSGRLDIALNLLGRVSNVDDRAKSESEPTMELAEIEM